MAAIVHGELRVVVATMRVRFPLVARPIGTKANPIDPSDLLRTLEDGSTGSNRPSDPKRTLVTCPNAEQTGNRLPLPKAMGGH